MLLHGVIAGGLNPLLGRRLKLQLIPSSCQLRDDWNQSGSPQCSTVDRRLISAALVLSTTSTKVT